MDDKNHEDAVSIIRRYINGIPDVIADITQDVSYADKEELKELLRGYRLSQLEWLQKFTIMLTQTVVSEHEEETETGHEDNAFMQGELTDNKGEEKTRCPFRNDDTEQNQNDCGKQKGHTKRWLKIKTDKHKKGTERT